MSIFDQKQKFESKDQVSQLKEEYAQGKITFKDLPKDVLVELLECAVERIDDLENSGEYDERDWKDFASDYDFIVEDLFKSIEDKIKFDVYE